MKKRAIMIALFLSLAVIIYAQEKPWFDTQNCAFCKQVAAQPGLLEHMNTEYHHIAGGYLAFTHIDKEYQEAFNKSQEGIAAVVKEMQTTGKMPVMCQHCAALGQLMMTPGVNSQVLHSDYGEIFMMTSSDSTVTAKLQAFADRTALETEKWKRANSPKE